MPRLPKIHASAFILAIFVLIACHGKDAKSETKAAAPARAADAAAVSGNDPCKLLAPSEIETIMGKLAGPPYRASGANPEAKGADCRYEAAAGRSIRVTVMWESGAQFIGMMGAMASAIKNAGLSELKLSDGSTVAGAWDKAHVNQCCEFNALRGDRLVTVDVAGSRATIAQAASLADTAVKRLDQPLDFDGTVGIKSAQERAAQRPKARSVCDLVTRTDAEAIAGTALLAPPKGDEDSCTYAWPLDASGSRYAIKLTMQWKDGFHEMRQTGSMIAQASSFLGMVGEGEQVSSDRAQRPWDEFSQSVVGVMAVKSDVLASVESGPYRQDIAKAFVEKAMVNLMK
ncbi:MAG: hypothetical protein JWL84_2469 [Rhodospirillales bacterium]|jgi:hypothetical protein|nr:hypothetical protein [Rhodospirillales bacterium]